MIITFVINFVNRENRSSHFQPDLVFRYPLQPIYYKLNTLYVHVDYFAKEVAALFELV